MSHVKKLALVFVAQILCLGCGTLWYRTTLNWLSDVFFICMFVVPVFGYTAVLYKAPMFEKIPRIPGIVCLGILSFFAAAGGLFIIGMTIMVAEVLLGIPWHD